MVYVETIERPQMLILDGPAGSGSYDVELLTSSDIEDVQGSWDLDLLPEKEAELPCIRQNALQALRKIEVFAGKPQCQQRLLDFGSGYGFFLSIAKEFGCQAYGLEPLVASSVYARQNFGLNIKTDTLHEDTFPPDYFDVITAFQVFEHIPYPRESLNYLAKSLKKDGIILIEVPRYDTWTVGMLRSHHRHFVPDHINFFSYKTLSCLMQECGFQVLSHFEPARIMSIRHLYVSWLSRWLPERLSSAGIQFLQHRSLWDKTIKLNVGDMLTIIGRKL